jgi:hypothetical protein
MSGLPRKLTRTQTDGLRPPIKNLATPVHSPHLSFTSIFPKFSPLNNLRKAMGAFSIAVLYGFLPRDLAFVYPSGHLSLWNSGM